MTQPIRCAIYTRKSSEEGLEQDFNSLHAQREACEAFIKSQKHEGWKLLPAAYDDGGISGGTMQRPGLQKLLDDVKAKKVDIIVVYKVDRLTRSLADFARMVELFDQEGISFVSVTQQFNTTSSMGRLTLNVLLSFAQFEREVTGERIRDKIKASKARGMWMGGYVPLGYRVEDRKLRVEPEHAELIQTIFTLYLEEGTITKLRLRLAELNIRRPASEKGTPPIPFTRGGLQTLLANPIYTGRIRHGKILHDGLHDAIISIEMWEAVQAQFLRNSQGERWRERVTTPLQLLGKLYDPEMRRLVGSHTIKKGRRYAFYISESLRRDPDPTGWRLPAKVVEAKVIDLTRSMLRDGVAISQAVSSKLDPANIHKLIIAAVNAAENESIDAIFKNVVDRVHIENERITITLRLDQLLNLSEATAEPLPYVQHHPVQLKRRGVETRLVIAPSPHRATSVDPQMVSTIAKGRQWFDDWLHGRITGYKDIVGRESISASYAGDVMKLAFLSPVIVEDIIKGRQPEALMVSHLTKIENIPLRWEDQAAQYGWP